MMERHFIFKDIVSNQSTMYGTAPNWKGIRPLFDHTMELFDKLPQNGVRRIKFKAGKNGDHYIHYIHELLLYTQKMMNNGKYYSTLLLRSLGIHYPQTRSLVGLNNAIKKHYNARIDTLLTFTVMRSRLEEMILNLYFLYKSNNLVKEKKWDDLYKLIFKINYSGYNDDVNLKFRKGSRLFKKFLDFLLKKNAKLHVSELTKYVIKQKDLFDDYRPTLSNQNFKKLTKEEKLYMMRFKTQNKDLFDANSYYSMKPITKFYDMLSLELHPNNLFLRNVITSIKDGAELALITRDHLSKIRECDDYICDTNEIVYWQTIKLIHFFLDKINGSEKDLELLKGFNHSVENRLMKNCKQTLGMG